MWVRTKREPDSQGVAWAPDKPYGNGSGYGYLDQGPAYGATGTVDLTADPWIYLSFREAPLLHYQVDVPPGQYWVTLMFAEFLAQAPGQRILSVMLQGATVNSSLDIYAEVQSYRALNLSYPVTVVSGPLDIQIVGQTGTAVLSGFEISGLQPSGSGSMTPTMTPSPSSTSSPTQSPTPASGQPITLQLS